MPQAHGWLTPDATPTGTRCITLNVPDDFDFMAMLKGAIVPLFDFSQYEEYGTLTPEECAQWWVDWDAENDWSACEVGPIVGEIMMLAQASLHAKWLACDGAEYNIVDYPDLYSHVGIQFGGDGVDTFAVPDLQGRFPLGRGDGAGLTSRAVGDAGGEETHVLTDTEMPAHDHDMTHNHDGSRVFASLGGGGTTSILRGSAGTDIVTAAHSGATGASGSDTAHENMPPFCALAFYIYTGV